LQNGPGVKGNWKTEYAQIPDNTIILPPYQNNPLEVVPQWAGIDIILSQHKFGIIQTALQLADYLGIGVAHIEHTMPTSDQLRAAVPDLKKLSANVNLFISKTSREQWGYGEAEAEVIEHGIDSSLFKPSGRPRQRQILTVGNDMIGRSEILGFDILQRVCGEMPLRIVGDTKGLSQPARNVYELIQAYDQSMIYINPSRYSPIPMSLLEAASMGCAVVTTDNNLISDIFTHNVDSIKTNNEAEMRSSLNRLLNDPNECRRLGHNARKMVVDRFSLKRFTQQWDEVFTRTANVRG